MLTWWASLLILALVIVIVAWLIIRNAAHAEPVGLDHPHVEEAHGQPVSAAEDNLEVVEGIGPKIAGILKVAGIATFSQLADADAGEVEKIIRAAGIRLGDPATWPEQARLAAAGDWEALKKFQGKLKGGRKV